MNSSRRDELTKGARERKTNTSIGLLLKVLDPAGKKRKKFRVTVPFIQIGGKKEGKKSSHLRWEKCKGVCPPFICNLGKYGVEERGEGGHRLHSQRKGEREGNTHGEF